MLGASLLKLVKFGFGFTSIELVVLLVGMIISFLVSLIVIKFLMSYIKKHNFKVFGYYRIILGIIVLTYFFLQKYNNLKIINDNINIKHILKL